MSLSVLSSLHFTRNFIHQRMADTKYRLRGLHITYDAVTYDVD